MSNGSETIRARWANQRWPNIGYFVHGQAKMDIAVLLDEIGRLRAALATIAAKLKGESALTFTHTLKSLDADLDYVERQLKAMK